MPQISRSALVPFSATQMYQLVNDVSAYPAFLPGCVGSRPFRKLLGGWHFIPLSDDACKVELHLDFEFTNKLVELAFGKVFKELAGNMVQAFTSRAKEVYSA